MRKTNKVSLANQIGQFADKTASICEAFDTTWEELQSDRIKSIIAKRVLALADAGERDPTKIRDAALLSLGL
jgi:hypothetical protein